jgi:hypothetical protein
MTVSKDILTRVWCPFFNSLDKYEVRYRLESGFFRLNGVFKIPAHGRGILKKRRNKKGPQNLVRLSLWTKQTEVNKKQIPVHSYYLS